MSQSLPSNGTSLGLLIGRVTAGGMMLCLHGWDKLKGFSDMKETFPDPMGVGNEISLVLAILGEVLAAGLIVLGLGTRFAAGGLAVVMGVAAFKVHLDDDWATKEKAILYCGLCLVLMFTGGGRFSLDAVAFKGKGQ